MMSEAQFWKEIDRLLLQNDIQAAAELVAEQLEAFNTTLKAKYDFYHPGTRH